MSFRRSRFGEPKIANRRLEAIHANRSNVTKIGLFTGTFSVSGQARALTQSGLCQANGIADSVSQGFPGIANDARDVSKCTLLSHPPYLRVAGWMNWRVLDYRVTTCGACLTPAVHNTTGRPGSLAQAIAQKTQWARVNQHAIGETKSFQNDLLKSSSQIVELVVRKKKHYILVLFNAGSRGDFQNPCRRVPMSKHWKSMESSRHDVLDSYELMFHVAWFSFWMGGVRDA